jgi:N,N'-diacetyllegionaminate synthase
MGKMMKISDFEIGDGNRPYIIAEMACAHDGEIDKAYKLVDMAVNAKANAIQFQIFHTNEIVVPEHHLHPLLLEIEFSVEEWIDLAVYAKKKNIHVMVCTYDVASVQLAIRMKADGIKLNSSDLLNFDVLKAVSDSGLPFTLGTGASTVDEITTALSFLEELGVNNMVLMHGVQNFPTQISDLNIERVRLLKRLFQMPVGYHDHTDADLIFSKFVDLIAIGLGANVIEKHITLDRSIKGTDYQAALEPKEFTEFVQNINTAYIALGKLRPNILSESDIKYRVFQKKSIVLISDLKEGDVLSRNKVMFLRNISNGVPPSEFQKMEGKTLNRSVRAYDNIEWKDIS